MTKLDSLATYGVIPGLDNHIVVHFSAFDEPNQTISFGKDDHLRFQRVYFRKASGPFNITVSGVGCVLANVKILI